MVDSNPRDAVQQRYLLPRLTASLQVRKALQSHQLDLLERLNTSVQSLKSTQTEAFAVLPTPKSSVLREDSAFSECSTLEELAGKIESENMAIDTVPHFTVLRCALASGRLDEQPTTEQLFKIIENNFPRFSLASNVELQVCCLPVTLRSPLTLSCVSHCRIGYGEP